MLPGPFLNWPWELLLNGVKAFQPCVGPGVLPAQPRCPTGHSAQTQPVHMGQMLLFFLNPLNCLERDSLQCGVFCEQHYCRKVKVMMPINKLKMSFILQESSVSAQCLSLYSVCMVSLLGTQDAYSLTCGRSSQLKKKQQNTNASSWLGKSLDLLLHDLTDFF